MGRVLTLRRIDAVRMDFYELLPLLRRYRRIDLESLSAFTYVSACPQEGLLPTPSYVRSILAGLDADLPHHRQCALCLLNTPTTAPGALATGLGIVVSDRVAKLLPRRLARLLRTYERVVLAVFVHALKDRSFTERLLPC